MKRGAMRLVASVVLATVVVGALSAPAASQVVERSKVTLTWAEFVKLLGYDPTVKGGERITVPWSDIEKLLGVDVEQVGKDAWVTLNWKEFQAMLKASLEKD